MTKITKETTLSEIIDDSRMKEILLKYQLPCLSCPFAESEMQNLKIGEICRMYGINLEKLLKDLNGLDKKS